MICSEIISSIEKKYPKNAALEWDNVGLLAGRNDKEVKKIYIASTLAIASATTTVIVVISVDAYPSKKDFLKISPKFIRISLSCILSANIIFRKGSALHIL